MATTLQGHPEEAYEVVGFSTRSFSGAAMEAVKRAGDLFAALGWGDKVGRFEVLQMRGPIEGGKRTGYQIRLRVKLAETL